MNNQKRIYKEVAEDTGFSEEQVKYTIEQYEMALRWYISNPLHGGSTIRIPQFGQFIINRPRFEKSLKKMESTNPEGKRYKYFKAFKDKFLNDE